MDKLHMCMHVGYSSYSRIETFTLKTSDWELQIYRAANLYSNFIIIYRINDTCKLDWIAFPGENHLKYFKNNFPFIN